MKLFSGLCALILLPLASTGCNRTPTYQWRVVEAPDKTFSVALPGNAVSEDTATRSATGGSFTSHRLTVRMTNAGYAISWWEDPSLRGSNPEQILDMMRDRGLAPSNARMLNERRLTVQGYPARDISAVAGGYAAYDNRLVLVGTRLYTLMGVDGTGKHDTRDIEKFFNSFALQ